MEILYFGEAGIDPPMYERIQKGEVEPHCKKCKAKLQVHRLKGESDGPITLIRCPTDQRHFVITYRVAMPEFDAFLYGQSREDSDE